LQLQISADFLVGPPVSIFLDWDLPSDWLEMTTPDIGGPLGLASLGTHMGGGNGDPLS
jgi:hypothetical protein